MSIKRQIIVEMKKNTYICKGRRVLRGKYKGKYCYRFSWYIWNLHNSDNEIEKGDGNVIHHKDKDELNDDINNLQKITNREHAKLHHKGENNPMYGKENKWGKHTKEIKNKISEGNKGKSRNKGEDHPMYGKENKHTKEMRKKMSEKYKGENNPMFGKKNKGSSEGLKEYWKKVKLGLIKRKGYKVNERVNF